MSNPFEGIGAAALADNEAQKPFKAAVAEMGVSFERNERGEYTDSRTSCLWKAWQKAELHFGWQQGDPPKDGTVIVARGSISTTWEDETSILSFTNAVRWVEDESGYKGWHYDDAESGMTVALQVDDVVTVHEWIRLAKAQPEGAAR